MPVFIGALDLTVVSAVLPQVIYNLKLPMQSSLSEAAWVVSGYLLSYTVAMTFMGRLSDLHGRRRVFLLSLAIFALGSYLVAVADGEPKRLLLLVFRMATGERGDPALMGLRALILARVVQAFGGGAMVPVSMALAGDLFPSGRRALALGVIGAIDTMGWVVGHLYGGIITRFFDWRVIFWLNIPVCLGAFLLILWALRGIKQERAPGGFDWFGALLISAVLILASIGLGGGGGEVGGSMVAGDQPPRIVPALLLAAVPLLLVFFRVEWRQSHPLVPLRLVREGNFAAACAANFLVGFSLIIAIADVPLFINGLVARSLAQGAWDSGWMLSGLTVPMAFAALLGGWLTSRRGYRVTAGLGLLSAIAGFILMSAWRPDTPYLAMLPHLALAGVGFGIVISPIATAVLEAASQAQRGVASALVIILRLCGMTLGASAVTTYGLQRSDGLMRTLLKGVDDVERAAQIGGNILNQVISETFWIAAAVCALAVLPVLMLRNRKTQGAIAAESIENEGG